MSDDANDTHIDQMFLGTGVTQEVDGKFAAVVKISGVTYRENAETVANWAIEVLHQAFVHCPPGGGTTRRVTSIPKDVGHG
jgi:hypothetical protein